ncbi:MAG: DNA-processing protein DprA [Acidiferrobacterales bacterium]
MEMTEAQQICWLDLHRIVALQPGILPGLLERFGSPQAVFDASRSELTECRGVTSAVADALLAGPDARHVTSELAWLTQDDAHLITISDAGYPRLLREIPDPPPLLYVRGDPTVLGRPQIAVAGSRNPTAGGCENAHAFAAAFCEAGLVVTSGLALGIDACAHRAALAARGRTIAVAGTGLDRVYPSQHRGLAHKIARCGALVSELPLGSAPRRENFPRRNRIISGMSLGVLVVEAALQSGSLITARLGAEQGREIFAIPGSIHSPVARGCHALIRQGAKLVESAADVLEEIGALVRAVSDVAAPADADGRDRARETHGPG